MPASQTPSKVLSLRDSRPTLSLTPSAKIILEHVALAAYWGWYIYVSKYGLLVAFEKLQDILSSLPEEEYKFRDAVKSIQDIEKDEKNRMGYNGVKEKINELR